GFPRNGHGGGAMAGRPVYRAGAHRHRAARHRRGELHAAAVRRRLRSLRAAGAGVSAGSHLTSNAGRSLSRSDARAQPIFGWVHCRTAVGPTSPVSVAARGRAVLATPLPYRKALHDYDAGAIAAPPQPELITPRQTAGKEDCVLERDRGRGSHDAVGLERGAQRMAAGDVRKGGAGGRGGFRRYQPCERKKARQNGRFLLHLERAHEVGGLVRRLAAVTRNITGGAAEIGPIELADAVV